MIIGLANLVIGGRGRDPEDIVVLCFLHHCCVCEHKRENRRGARKNEMGRKGKERKGVTRKWRLYSSDAQYCISREVLFRGRKQFFKRFGVSQWQWEKWNNEGIGFRSGKWAFSPLWPLVFVLLDFWSLLLRVCGGFSSMFHLWWASRILESDFYGKIKISSWKLHHDLMYWCQG